MVPDKAYLLLVLNVMDLSEGTATRLRTPILFCALRLPNSASIKSSSVTVRVPSSTEGGSNFKYQRSTTHYHQE
jgi:hypothetical protein